MSVLAPEAEKARSFGAVQAGVPAGQVIAFLIVPLVSAHYGWEAAFYLFACVGFLWCGVWVALGVGGLLNPGSLIPNPRTDLTMSLRNRPGPRLIPHPRTDLN